MRNNHRQPIRTFAAAIALTAALASPSARAADPQKPTLTIELNTAQRHGSACRLSFLIENKLGQHIAALDLELVLFDQQKRIMKLLAVAAGSFPAAKTRIKQFDIQATSCTEISRILLNTITRCDGDKLTPESCLVRTITRSGTTIPLVY